MRRSPSSLTYARRSLPNVPILSSTTWLPTFPPLSRIPPGIDSRLRPKSGPPNCPPKPWSTWPQRSGRCVNRPTFRIWRTDMTYTYTYTRTDLLVDQVDIFLRSSGIEDAPRKRVVDAITEKWIEAVGVFVVKDGQRVLEGSLEIGWKAHSDHADLTISTDLPGWEGGAAPELA